MACCADGTRLAATTPYPYETPSGSGLWLSTNSGASWAPSSLASGSLGATWSGDGTRLAAVGFESGTIYTSTDFGVSWNQTTIADANWYCITSSFDGTKLAVGAAFRYAAPQYSTIYTSADGGATWTRATAPAAVCLFLTCSADGTKLAGVYGGHIFVSKDSGATWSDSINPLRWWGAVTFSADGTKLFAPSTENGGIYSLQSGPRLEVSTLGGQILLSWPAYGTGLGLGHTPDPSTNLVVQQSSEANGSGWTDLTVVPTVTNLVDQIVLPPGSDRAFYRLRSN